MSKQIANMLLIALFAVAAVIFGATFANEVFDLLNQIAAMVVAAVSPALKALVNLYAHIRAWVVENSETIIAVAQVVFTALTAQLAAVLTNRLLEGTRHAIARSEARYDAAGRWTRPVHAVALIGLKGCKGLAFLLNALVSPFSIPAQMRKDRMAIAGLARMDQAAEESAEWAYRNSAQFTKAATIKESAVTAHPQVDLPPISEEEVREGDRHMQAALDYCGETGELPVR